MADVERPHLKITARLTADEAAAVLKLVAQAAHEDGVAPLSEHAMLHLRYGGDRQARDVLLLTNGEIAGYAHLEPSDAVEGQAGELVVHPDYRCRHLGLALVKALAKEAGQDQLRLWAHGDLPAARRLAAAAGFERVRALWQMRRSLETELDEPHLPDGISIRTFRVGQDEDDWTALNGRAFATHPEQGSWTREDLDLREREPWFNADGFFLAERDGKLVGFHWTKVHGLGGGEAARGSGGGESVWVPGGGESVRVPGGGESIRGPGGGESVPDPGGGESIRGPDGGESDHLPEAIGEVYVVGVDPAERGSGLGRALTLIGLRYLRSRGLSQVMLYVDESNTAAIRLYESLGFSRWHTDVMFAEKPSESIRA